MHADSHFSHVCANSDLVAFDFGNKEKGDIKSKKGKKRKKNCRGAHTQRAENAPSHPSNRNDNGV